MRKGGSGIVKPVVDLVGPRFILLFVDRFVKLSHLSIVVGIRIHTLVSPAWRLCILAVQDKILTHPVDLVVLVGSTPTNHINAPGMPLYLHSLTILVQFKVTQHVSIITRLLNL
jgi:hypothetical protein